MSPLFILLFIFLLAAIVTWANHGFYCRDAKVEPVVEPLRVEPAAPPAPPPPLSCFVLGVIDSLKNEPDAWKRDESKTRSDCLYSFVHSDARLELMVELVFVPERAYKIYPSHGTIQRHEHRPLGDAVAAWCERSNELERLAKVAQEKPVIDRFALRGCPPKESV